MWKAFTEWPLVLAPLSVLCLAALGLVLIVVRFSRRQSRLEDRLPAPIHRDDDAALHTIVPEVASEDEATPPEDSPFTVPNALTPEEALARLEGETIFPDLWIAHYLLGIIRAGRVSEITGYALVSRRSAGHRRRVAMLQPLAERGDPCAISEITFLAHQRLGPRIDAGLVVRYQALARERRLTAELKALRALRGAPAVRTQSTGDGLETRLVVDVELTRFLGAATSEPDLLGKLGTSAEELLALRVGILADAIRDLMRRVDDPHSRGPDGAWLEAADILRHGKLKPEDLNIGSEEWEAFERRATSRRLRHRLERLRLGEGRLEDVLGFRPTAQRLGMTLADFGTSDAELNDLLPRLLGAAVGQTNFAQGARYAIGIDTVFYTSMATALGQPLTGVNAVPFYERYVRNYAANLYEMGAWLMREADGGSAEHRAALEVMMREFA